MLKQLGATPNPQNLYFLSLWTLDEEPPNALPQMNNPLAMTDPYRNSGQWETGIWNSAGVVKFDTLEHGGTANAVHLQADVNNDNGYLDVIQALKGNSMLAMWKAVNKSKWCSGCAGGLYPSVPYRALAAGGVAPKVGTPLAGDLPTSPGQPSGSQGQMGPIGPSGAKGAKGVTCASKGDAIKIGPSFFGTSISQCNIKALTGGMITILGVQMLFLGVVVVGLGLGLKTQTGQAVKRTATKAAKTAVTRRIPKPASATKAAREVSAPPAPPAPPVTAARTTRAA